MLPDQADEGLKARELLARHDAGQDSLWVNHIVLCEVAWVLGRTYRYSRQQVHDALVVILATPAFAIPQRDKVDEALAIFRATRADFADVLIGVLNRRAGCATTYTFDRRAAETADFSAVE